VGGVLPVHFDLIHEDSREAFVCSKLLDFLVGAWFLSHELVARECNDVEAFVTVFAHHIIELLCSRAHTHTRTDEVAVPRKAAGGNGKVRACLPAGRLAGDS